MKFSVNRQDLMKVMGSVLRATENKDTLPVLKNILICCKDNSALITATNLELTVKTSIIAKIKEEGSITVPAKIFANFISCLEQDEVSLETKGNFLHFNDKSKIQGIPADEFPIIPEIDYQINFSLPSSLLAKSLEEVSFTASNNFTRPVLNTILFSIQDSELILAATNSYRLAEKKLNIKNKIKDDKSFLIPLKSAIEVISIIKQFNEEIKVLISENQIEFQLKDIKIISRLTEGKFPDYKSIIPSESNVSVLFSVEKLLQGIRRTLLFSDSSFKGIFEIKDGKISIFSENNSKGSDLFELPVEIIEGDKSINLKLAINLNYVFEVLSKTNFSNMRLNLVDSIKPIVFLPEKDLNYKHILMPLKV